MARIIVIGNKSKYIHREIGYLKNNIPISPYCVFFILQILIDLLSTQIPLATLHFLPIISTFVIVYFEQETLATTLSCHNLVARPCTLGVFPRATNNIAHCTTGNIYHGHPGWMAAVEVSLTNHMLTDNATSTVVNDYDLALATMLWLMGQPTFPWGSKVPFA